MEAALFKTIVSLVVVLGLMALLVVGLRKLFHVGFPGSSNIVDIDILGQRSVQPKRTLYVVKVLNKVLVLSATEHGIAPLGEIDDETALKAVEARQETLRLQHAVRFPGIRKRAERSQSFAEFFQKPFNVVLWRAAKDSVGTPRTQKSAVPQERAI